MSNKEVKFILQNNIGSIFSGKVKWFDHTVQTKSADAKVKNLFSAW